MQARQIKDEGFASLRPLCAESWLCMLTVYGRKSSFNLQKVMWLVAELSLAHRHIELGGSFGGLDTPEFRAMNPHGHVPVIDDEGTIVWESHAILRYLAACYGRGRFWSSDAAQRSLSDRWMDWSQTTLQPDFLIGVFWGYYRTPASERNMAAVDEKVRRCGQHFRLLDSILADRLHGAIRGAARSIGLLEQIPIIWTHSRHV
jgi:glutathione S-transferase